MKLSLPGLLKEPLPSGGTRYRVRVAGVKARRITLPVTPDHPEFLELYHAARRGIALQPQASPTDRAIRHSVAWLTHAYLDHLATMVTAGQADAKTLTQRRAMLQILRDHRSTAARSAGEPFADLHMAIPTDQIIALRDTHAATPGKADNLLKAVRAMYRWACDSRIMDHNPAANVARINRGKGGATPWTVEDLRQFRTRHPAGTTAHLSLTLLMFTAARASDAILLGRRHERQRDGITWLDWHPAKRGSRPVSIPMMPPLAAAIRAQQVIGPTYVLTDYGRPFASPASFGNRFRKWCEQAGLTDRSPHGIRKAAGLLLAHHGATQHQIMAIHGHAQAKTSEIYTREADRLRLARDAMGLLAGLEW